MSTHDLKIQTRWLDRVLSGEKRAEVRLHDRDFQVHDVIAFTEVRADGFAMYNARRASATITHVLDGRMADGVHDGYCVLSIADPELIEDDETDGDAS